MKINRAKMKKGSVPHIYHGAERPIYKRLFSGWNENVAGRVTLK